MFSELFLCIVLRNLSKESHNCALFYLTVNLKKINTLVGKNIYKLKWHNIILYNKT